MLSLRKPKLNTATYFLQSVMTTTITDYFYHTFGQHINKHSAIKKQIKLTSKSRAIPVARLAWLQPKLLQASNDEVETTTANYDGITVFYYHNDHLGTPNELVDDKGNVVWLADYQAWGNTAKVIWTEQKIGNIAVSRNELQPIRFQGQSIDEDTGLHYNRFRYYDNDVGMFISRDPIGLMGGDNIFQYAPNPTGWVDPLGLNYGTESSRIPTGYDTKSSKNIQVDSELKPYVDNLINKSPTFKDMYNNLNNNESIWIGFGIKDKYKSNSITAGLYSSRTRNVYIDRSDLGKDGLYYFDKDGKACISCKISIERTIAHEFAHAFERYNNGDNSERNAIRVANIIMKEMNQNSVDRHGHNMTYTPKKYR